MSLQLVIGPANAEKARVALEAYRGALAAGCEPVLVVPTFADVEVYRRELAASGAVFGVEVVRFGWLLREIAKRAGLGGRPVGGLARERVAAVAVARTRLEALAASAATPGFAAALLRLVTELEELRLEPPRVIAALRAWTQDDAARRVYADELGALYAAYRRELERAGALDQQLHDAAALDALRLAPAAWGDTPVVIYGFDDLTALQHDAVETLACHAGAEVTLTLTYEPGRTALAARASSFEDLRALPGVEVRELAARTGHHSSDALHHLERTLFEPENGSDGGEALRLFDARAVVAGDALLLLEGGGERAEVELVAAHVARLIREGCAPEEIAVVWRTPDDVARLVEEVFAAYTIPFALTLRLRARDTALGRGVIALLGCALLDGTADDLLTWLRTPGLLEHPDLADRLELDVRRKGARTARDARALWEERHWPLDAITRVATAHGRGPAALCDRMARETGSLFARPHRLQAPILGGPARTDSSAAAALRSALRELGRLAKRDPDLVPAPAELERLLADLPVFAGEQAAPGRVQVTRPGAIRARRVRALFLCGLNEGAFPKAATPDPLLSDDDRAAINAAAGTRLSHHADRLAGERFLLYTAVSRPTDLLALSWHAADEDGEPRVRSLFVDDVVERFADAPLERVHRRALGAAGWAAEEAPVAREVALAAAAQAPGSASEVIAPLSPDVVAAVLPADRPLSATAIDLWLACPVKWFVERLLHPKELAPDPEQMVRGTVAHLVLADVFAAFRDRGLDPAGLPQARAIMHESLPRHAAEHTISVNQEALRGHVRRLEADLLRYLDFAARDGSDLVPTHFELPFEVELGALPLQGRIDRIDVHGGQAVLVDYKGKTAPAVAKWIKDGKLQLGLYLLAARELARRGELLAEPAGALYQPIGAKDDQRPRGLLVGDADLGRTSVGTDRLAEEEAEAVLAEVLDAALGVVRDMRAGRLTAKPDSCAYQGGCQYPTICRCEA